MVEAFYVPEFPLGHFREFIAGSYCRNLRLDKKKSNTTLDQLIIISANSFATCHCNKVVQPKSKPRDLPASSFTATSHPGHITNVS
jgi:hypothetical protein